jgi:diguanylate cyclase (GGDEF)-like protein
LTCSVDGGAEVEAGWRSNRGCRPRIKYLAEHDTLSGLLNAGAFQTALHRALAAAARDGKELAVLVADLDDFKEINDTFGHYAGDVVLREVGERIRGALGRDDVAARCGGDEFAIALTVDALAAARAEEVATTILAAVSETIEVDGHEIRLGMSIGIATYPEHGLESDALVSMADLALYSAKREGRGRFQFFVTALGDSVRWRRQVERELRAAVDDKTIDIAYQPLIRIADRWLMGAEALARWHSRELGTVSPATFIPIAEQTGIIVPLGRLILERACRDAAGWTGALAEMPVSVNVSPVQFQRDDLVDRVRGALSASGLAPARLVLEITESLLLELDEQRGTLGVLDELRQIGVKIALDDFGVGYSNLSRLRRLPIQRLKIDRAFLRDVEEDGQQRRVLHTMVMLGQSLGVETTAEGVETEAQLNLLAEIGCYQAQGFFFGLPMPARELADLAARWLPIGDATARVRLAS